MRKIKYFFIDVRNFIKNTFRFRSLLINYREYSADWAIESFFKQHLELLIRFYSNSENCWQWEEGRQEILDQLLEAKRLLVSAFDESYYLRDIDFDLDDMFEEKDGFTILKKHENDWTSEEIVDSIEKHKQAKLDFFEYIANKSSNWWD